MTRSDQQPNLDHLAAVLLETAAAIEAQEQRIKQCLLRAAQQGDSQLVRELVELWLTQPVELAAEYVGEAQPDSESGRTSSAA